VLFASSAVVILVVTDNTELAQAVQQDLDEIYPSSPPAKVGTPLEFHKVPYVLDGGLASASSTNSWIAGRAREMSLTCRLSSGK
jgi:hypothetical protein